MKKFDRAMYAIFLLALLADVARSRVPAPVGGDSVGGLILSAANQLGAGSAVEAVSGLRRSNDALPRIARLKAIRSTISGWARVLSRQPNGLGPVMLTALASGSDAGSGSSLVATFHPASPSLAIFEHTGSPAP